MKQALCATPWLLSFIWTLVIGNKCVYQECLCIGTMIMCETNGMHEIPQKSYPSPNLGFLNLDNNFITNIPAGSLPSNLKGISLVNNPLTIIDDSAFNESADTLESAIFSNALLTRLPDAFLRLNALKTLRITDTNIADWNTNVMIHIGQSLETLELFKCGVMTWPTWIQTFTQLTELTISSGHISSVPDGVFDKVADKLSSLDLYNNNLTLVPKALSSLSALRDLQLEGNKISDVEWLPRKSNLTNLSLNNNRISDSYQLSRVLLPYSASLSGFYIENNQLTAIPNISFLTQVTNLDLSNNLISDPSSGSLPSNISSLSLQTNLLPLIPRVMKSAKDVTDMLLFSNNITEIRQVDFPSWTISAEISFNRITELTNTSFPQQSLLRFLSLNHNPISRISSQAFTNTPHLSKITLQYTKLTRVPLPLVSAAGLLSVDFTGSADLVCTCAEKDFGQWMLSRPAKTITGDCGEVKIYNFFVSLGPNCP